MFTVGLTGGIGSGKSTASELFSEWVPVIDADVEARRAVLPGTEALSKIIERFGWTIIEKEGVLNRKKLRRIIFDEPAQKDWLENLLHPIIRKQITDMLKNSAAPYQVLVSPLLLETDQKELVNRILVIDASEDVQVHRTCTRDQSEPSQVRVIINSQMNRMQRLKMADDIVLNNSHLEDLHKAIKNLHIIYSRLAKNF